VKRNPQLWRCGFLHFRAQSRYCGAGSAPL